MSIRLAFEAEEQDKNQRIDRYLADKCQEVSRSYLQKLLKSEQVMVNGKPVKSNYRMIPGDTVFLEIPDAVEPEIAAEKMELDIIYEDEDIIVINKPKGMVVHPAAGHYTGTLVNGLMYHCRDQLSGINGILRPGIVHRIDMNTTGVLVACKNDTAHRCLAEQLKEHTITRRYQAIVHGVVRDDHGTVDRPIGRHPADRKRMSVSAPNGRRAVTHYQVLKRFQHYTYVECCLETGRTHQIRVHMSSMHHPLLGDEVYGSSRKMPAACIRGMERLKIELQGQTLHACILGIQHPRTGEYMEFQAPLPAYFQEILQYFQGADL